jgi:hypothetical protein
MTEPWRHIDRIVEDLSLPQASKEIYEELKEEEISIDFLINDDGFGGQGGFFERKWELDLAMTNVNILALTALTRLFLPDFVKRNSGRILNVSSTAALTPGPPQAVHHATKAYVTFSNALGEELSDTHIRVTALMPGATETQFAKTSGMDKTVMFRKTFSARRVAEDGYNGMIAGKLNVISSVSFAQRLMLAAIPFIPKRMLLRSIRKMAEAT